MKGNTKMYNNAPTTHQKTTATATADPAGNVARTLRRLRADLAIAENEARNAAQVVNDAACRVQLALIRDEDPEPAQVDREKATAALLVIAQRVDDLTIAINHVAANGLAK